MAYARAVDGNQKAENAKLRQMGFAVANTSRIGHGFPDAAVSKCGVTVLVEWKLTEKSKLTPDEVKFHDNWRGVIVTATTAEQVAAKITELIARSA